jgi:hypothetical protein
MAEPPETGQADDARSLKVGEARQAEAARAEFNALREEIKTRQQASHTAISVGLTAAAAIAGVALGGERGDRLEILLVLPIVLVGLGAFYLEHSRASFLIGAYLNNCVWNRMHEGFNPPAESWESYLSGQRTGLRGQVLGVLPGLLIFVVPSVAALIANANWDVPIIGGFERTTETGVPETLPDPLIALWVTGFVALLALVVLLAAVFWGRPSVSQRR